MFETYFLFLILLIMITYDNNLLYELKNNKIWQMVFVCIVLYISYNSLILGIIVILIFAFFYERNSKYGSFEYFSSNTDNNKSPQAVLNTNKTNMTSTTTGRLTVEDNLRGKSSKSIPVINNVQSVNVLPNDPTIQEGFSKF